MRQMKVEGDGSLDEELPIPSVRDALLCEHVRPSDGR